MRIALCDINKIGVKIGERQNDILTAYSIVYIPYWSTVNLTRLSDDKGILMLFGKNRRTSKMGDVAI